MEMCDYTATAGFAHPFCIPPFFQLVFSTSARCLVSCLSSSALKAPPFLGSWASSPPSCLQVSIFNFLCSCYPENAVVRHRSSFLPSFPETDLGASYGTAKSTVGLCSMGVMHPSRVMKQLIAVIMAGILGIYGLITAILLISASTIPSCRSPSPPPEF